MIHHYYYSLYLQIVQDIFFARNSASRLHKEYLCQIGTDATSWTRCAGSLKSL